METLFALFTAALVVGLLYSPITIGLALSFRHLNYPDLTIEGSVMLSGAATIFVLNEFSAPWTSLLVGVVSGALAGAVTGALHLFARVSRLLSGIITTAFGYSLAIRFLGGRANLRATVPTFFGQVSNDGLVLGIIMIGLVFAVVLFGVSFIGQAMRALGDRERFIEGLGLNPKVVLLGGLALANSIVGFGGAILVHYKGYFDINMAIGILISALAAMALGELTFAARRVWQHTAMCVVGTIVYNLAVGAFYFSWNLPFEKFILASDVRFLSGALLVLPAIVSLIRGPRYRLFSSDW